jgi:hypothetical protein
MKAQVAPVPTSPSILKVAADPVNPVPTVFILAHPAVPFVAAVPVYPTAVPNSAVPEVAPIDPLEPPQPIPIIVASTVLEVPAGAVSAVAGCEPVYIVMEAVPPVPIVPAIF